MNLQYKHVFNSLSIQRGLNLFAFLLAFPGFEFLGNSLYFYVFLWLLYKTSKRTGKAIPRSRFAFLLFLSWIFGLVSTVFHPPLISASQDTLGMALMLLRYAYWFAIGAYFFSWIKYINLYKLAKWITYGYILQVVGFYLLRFKLDAIIFSFNSGMSRNGFVFNSIIFSGFLFYYFFSKYGKRAFGPTAIFIFFNLLLTNGRSGAIIGLLIVLINFTLINSNIRRLSKVFLILLFASVLFNNSLEKTLSNYGALIAPMVASANPRFASLLRGEGSGDLTFDKSWLIRELMVDKTVEIIQEYPFLGVGYSNFNKYNAPLHSLSSEKFIRLQYRTKLYLNTRSAHNSYANHLGETGLIGFGLLLLILFPIVLWFLKNFWTGNFINYGYIIFLIVGTIGALIHGYAIAAFTGANVWFMLGISRGLIKNE